MSQDPRTRTEYRARVRRLVACVPARRRGHDASQRQRGAVVTECLGSAAEAGRQPHGPRRRRGIAWAWAVVHATFVLLHSGCPGSSTTTVPLPAAPPDVAPGAGAGIGGSVTGAAGTGAGTNTAGQAGSATPAPPPLPPGLACGPVSCPQPLNIVGNLLREALGVMTSLPPTVACCLDSELGVCGTSDAIDSCEPAAEPDPKCPGIDLSALAAIVGGLGAATPSGKSGCCTHDLCGIDGHIFGRGCIENEEMTKVVNALPVVGPLIVVPGRAVCQSRRVPDPDAPDAGS